MLFRSGLVAGGQRLRGYNTRLAVLAIRRFRAPISCKTPPALRAPAGTGTYHWRCCNRHKLHADTCFASRSIPTSGRVFEPDRLFHYSECGSHAACGGDNRDRNLGPGRGSTAAAGGRSDVLHVQHGDHRHRNARSARFGRVGGVRNGRLLRRSDQGVVLERGNQRRHRSADHGDADRRAENLLRTRTIECDNRSVPAAARANRATRRRPRQ